MLTRMKLVSEVRERWLRCVGRVISCQAVMEKAIKGNTGWHRIETSGEMGSNIPEIGGEKT